MKKSLLCILLACVLLLGGCVLTDFPVKTEGMVESAKMIIDLRYMHFMVQYLCDWNSYIFSSGKLPQTITEYQKAYDSIHSECQRLKENIVLKCLPLLQSSLENEQDLDLLLGDFEKAGNLCKETFYIIKQNLENSDQPAAEQKALENRIQKALDSELAMADHLDEEISDLVKVWEKSLLSLTNVTPEQMQKIQNYRAGFVYLDTAVSTAHLLDRCHLALRLELQKNTGNDALFANFPIQAIDGVAVTAYYLTTQYETASPECQQLYEPVYLKVVTIMASKSALLYELTRDAQKGNKASIEKLKQYERGIAEWMKDMLNDLTDEEFVFFDNFRQLV